MGFSKKKPAAPAPPPPPARAAPVPPGQSRFVNNDRARAAATTQPQYAAAAPMQPQYGAATPVPAAPSAGMGMMGTMATSMAGSMAGSMIGNSLSGMMSGSSDSAQPAAPAQPAPAQTAWAQAPQTLQSPPSVDVCSVPQRQFLMCMSDTGDDMEQCKYLYDALKSCNQAHAQ